MLSPRAEYSVRFASKDVWDSAKGTNVLTKSLPIDATVTGDIDPTAKEFAPL
jgi:hypothetical protein